MGAYGYRGVERAILEEARGAPTLFPNRSAGERMIGSADYLRRFGDRSFVDRVTPRFRRDVQSFERQLDASAATGLLRARALRRRHHRPDLRPARAGARAPGPAGDRRTSGREPGTAAARGAGDRAWPTGSRPGCAARSPRPRTTLPDGSLFVPIALVDGLEQPLRRAHRLRSAAAYWNLVMPYVLASGFIRPGSAEATGAAALPAEPRLALPRPRPLQPAHGRHQPGVRAARLRRRLRHERRPLPRRQRPAGPAGAQPLRQARRGDDREHLRLRRGLDDRAVLRPVLPLDAPAAEQREQRLLPRDAAADARARDQRRERRAAGARARLRDAARLARGGQADRGAAPADELRAALVHARRRCHLGAGRASTCRAASAGRCGCGCDCRPASGSAR